VSEMRLVTEALRHWGRADRDGVTLDVRTRCTNSNNVQRQHKILPARPLGDRNRQRVNEELKFRDMRVVALLEDIDSHNKRLSIVRWHGSRSLATLHTVEYECILFLVPSRCVRL
jgi:hypothetical protein